MEHEVKEVIYIALSALVLSLVLTLASYAMRVNNEIADIRNGQIVALKQVKQYNEFNNYNKKTLIGDDIIECVRLYYNSGLDIFVDRRTNVVTGLSITELPKDELNTVCPDCVKFGDSTLRFDHRYFNHLQFSAHNKDGSNNYFDVSVNSADKNQNDLRNWFPSDEKYRAYLVYNSEDVGEFYKRIIDGFYTIPGVVTGDAATNRLDGIVQSQPPNSEVTGIVFISLNTYGGN